MAERKHAMDTSDDAGYEDPVMEKAIAAESKDPKAAAKLYHEIIQRRRRVGSFRLVKPRFCFYS